MLFRYVVREDQSERSESKPRTIWGVSVSVRKYNKGKGPEALEEFLAFSRNRQNISVAETDWVWEEGGNEGGRVSQGLSSCSGL